MLHKLLLVSAHIRSLEMEKSLFGKTKLRMARCLRYCNQSDFIKTVEGLAAPYLTQRGHSEPAGIDTNSF
jgi:hypothetical protein